VKKNEKRLTFGEIMERSRVSCFFDSQCILVLRQLGPNLQNILRQSYDNLTIMPKLRSTYDERLIYKTAYEGHRLFLGMIHLQSCKIV